MTDQSPREVLGEGKFLRFVREGRWEFVEQANAHGSAAVLAVTPQEEIVLVEQYRPAVTSRVIELPAGIVGDEEAAGEESIDAARRELLEEAGYAAAEIRALGSGPSSAGLAREIVEIFFATGLEKKHDGGGVGNEDIAVHLVPWKSVREWIRSRREAGVLVDLRVYSAFEMAEAEGLLER